MEFMRTQRLILRNAEAKDAAEIYDYRNHALCARFQRGQTKDIDGIHALIEKRKHDVLSAEDNCFIAVALKSTDELIGEIIVMPTENTFSLGYTFSYKHHRKGYAYEALSALHEDLHARYPDWEFICFTDPDNIPSMHLLKKLGYRDMGYLRNKDSQVFGMHTTEETDEELARVTER